MNRIKTTDEFIEQARLIHGGIYDYSKVGYISIDVKVIITCLTHGDFKQTPSNHYQGKGCPECRYIKSSNSKKKFHQSKRDWNFTQPEEYKLIPLSNGEFAMVDNEDFDMVKDINWTTNNYGYVRNASLGMIHRFIMTTPDELDIDHINHNKLDNRKNNLRVATRSQNIINTRPRKGTSKYKGVCWIKNNRKWLGYVNLNGKRFRLGLFTNEVECAKARDRKALELFGDFAYLNFPELKEEYLKKLKMKRIS